MAHVFFCQRLLPPNLELWIMRPVDLWTLTTRPAPASLYFSFPVCLSVATARIAQRFALVKIHKLWNSGRAEPCSGKAITFTTTVEGEDEDVDVINKLKGQEARPAAAETGAEARGRATAPAVPVGGVFVQLQLEADVGHAAGGGGAKEGPFRASLEATVLGIAGLPQEVLRRIVSYSSL